MNKALFKFQQQYFPTFLLKRKRKSAISKSGFPWGSVNSFLRSLKLHDTSSENARDYFLSQKVSPGFVNEMINGVTRANYAQQVNQVHPLVSMVAMGALNQFSIQGGNAQISKRFLEQSGASIRTGLRGDVTGLLHLRPSSSTSPSHAQWWVGTRDGHGEIFDAVIVATPWHGSRITLLDTDRSVPMYEMQKVHVTIVVTDASQPSHDYFHYGPSFKVPLTIVTTPAPDGSAPEVCMLHDAV